jgi:hypothetical protein
LAKIGIIWGMIWILALLVLAAGIGMGLRLGAICTAFSFLAIVIGTLFASLLGHLFKHILPHVGIENPVLVWMTAPISGFFLVYVIIMAIGFEVHRRAGVFYKYKAGDLRRVLWERLNLRLGGCLGVLNGTAWLLLVCFFIFNLSYLTAQVAPSETEARMTRIMNNLGQGLQSTGLDKAARAVGSVPDTFYKTADFAGLLAQNPNLSDRLGNYPAFISLTERSDVQNLAQDSSLVSAWQQGAPMGAVLNDPQVKAILANTNLVATIWSIIETNMDDITNFLLTGQSPKYDPEKIIGHWNFDLVPTLAALRDSKPDLRPNDIKVIRMTWAQAFSDTTFVAGTDGQIFLKGLPNFKDKPPTPETWTGQWSGDDSNYDLTLSLNGQTLSGTAETDGLRLTIKTSDNTYVFERAN